MQKLHKLYNPHHTPQSQPLPGQVANSAGGYSWALDPWARLERFLILGTEGGSYYIGEQTLTRENAQTTLELLREDGVRVVERVLTVSTSGRAHKNDPALFVLALAFSVGDEATRRAARTALPGVARTGTHLFTFLTYADSMRGWGRGLRKAVAAWYDGKGLDDLAYTVTKYAQRGGWTHRDALRLAHPKTGDLERDALYGYITGKRDKLAGLSGDWLDYLAAVESVKGETDARKAIDLIRRYRLPREVISTELLNRVDVWEALLETMPMTATIRNLATMTRVGLLTPMSPAADTIAERLTDSERLKRARVHPIGILAALMTYSAGRGVRGSNTWSPVATVVDALDMAFYLTFDNVEATGKRQMLALDVSGSMGAGSVGGVPGLTPAVASAAMALVTAATETRHSTVAFCTELVEVAISPRQRLDDVVKTLSGMPFGGTDCAQPMLYATQKRLELDAFVIYTDSETWFGNVHPAEALREYRRTMGIPAKLIVVGMLGNRFTIADPNDAGMLDVVGFSPDAPAAMADFIRE